MGTSADQLSTEQIISAIARLSLPELEQVFDHVLALQARRKAAALSAAESALLARVNQGLASGTHHPGIDVKATRLDCEVLWRRQLDLSTPAGVKIAELPLA